MDESIHLPVIAVQAAPGCAHPQASGGVLEERKDLVVAQTQPVPRIMLVVDKLAHLAVESFQSTTVGPDPEYSLVVLDHAKDLVLAQTVGVMGIVFVHLEAEAIVAVQAL
jgi:hypothetical protein